MSDASILQGGQRVHARQRNLLHLVFYFCLLSVLAGLAAGAFQASRENRIQHWKPWDRAKIEAHYQRRIGVTFGGLGGIHVQDLVPPGYKLGKYTDAQLDAWLNLWWHRKYEEPVQQVYAAAVGGAGLAMLLLILSAIRMSKTKEKHVRGAELKAAKSLRREVLKRSRGKPSVEILPGVPIAADDEFKHSFLLGTTGAGKSQALNHILAQARAKGEKVLVYDPGCVFVSSWHRPGDTIMNPLDERSAAWDVMREIETPMDCDAISDSAIQSNGQGGQGADEYFLQGARIVMSETLKMLKAEGLGMSDVFERLSLWGMDRLHGYLNGTPAGIFLDPNAKGSGSGGVKTTLQTKVAGWQYLPLVEGSPFSIRDWVSSGSGWLFLTSKEKDHKSLEPMISLWVELAARQILSREPGQGERIWIVIDELASLQRMPALLRLLAMGRKYRAVVVLATQSPGQVERIWRREGLREIQDTVGTRVLFRLEDADSAEMASKILGERESDRQQVADSANRSQGGGVNFNTQRSKERIVLPSEIQALPDLSCFVRLAGGYQPARVSFDYIDRPAVVPGMVPRYIPFGFTKQNIHEDTKTSTNAANGGFELNIEEGRDA